MEIIKMIGIALTAVILIVILKQYKPEFAVYISLIASIAIIFIFIEKLSAIILFINSFSQKLTRRARVYKNTIKNNRHCYFNRIRCAVYARMREKIGISAKLDLGGKVIIIAMSIPIISSMLETVAKILP